MKMMRYVLSLICGLSLVACGGKDEPTTQKQLTEKPQLSNPKEDPKAQPKAEPTPPALPPAPGEENPPKADAPKTTTRPDALYMAQRSVAEWAVPSSDYLQKLDLDALILDGKANGIDLKALAPYIKVYATTPEVSTPYYFTAEDIAESSIKNLKYDGYANRLSFDLVYKGITSTQPLHLTLDKMAYFDARVKLRSDFAGERYLYGTSKHLDLYSGAILDYDQKRYAAVIDNVNGISANGSMGELSFDVTLTKKNSDGSEPIARLRKTLSGFRNLSMLQQDLKVSSSHNLQQDFKKRLEKAQDNVAVKRALENTIRLWEKHLMLTIRGTQLVHLQDGTFVPEQKTQEYADLYFEHCRFELESAQIDGSDLVMQLRLLQTNEQAVQNVQYTVRVSAVKN